MLSKRSQAHWGNELYSYSHNQGKEDMYFKRDKNWWAGMTRKATGKGKIGPERQDRSRNQKWSWRGDGKLFIHWSIYSVLSTCIRKRHVMSVPQWKKTLICSSDMMCISLEKGPERHKGAQKMKNPPYTFLFSWSWVHFSTKKIPEFLLQGSTSASLNSTNFISIPR